MLWKSESTQKGQKKDESNIITLAQSKFRQFTVFSEISVLFECHSLPEKPMTLTNNSKNEITRSIWAKSWFIRPETMRPEGQEVRTSEQISMRRTQCELTHVLETKLSIAN
jgi:hypothetical protein